MADEDLGTARLVDGDPRAVTVPTPMPGRLIADRYRLHGELGRGGMGVVWRGEDQVIGRPVAVKEMWLGAQLGEADRAEFESRILREARTAGRLNDPAVVTVFDVVHDDGSIFIVMELVEAQTLAQLIRAAGPLPPATVAHIGQQLLAALEAAHAAGIVHRDVKPSNIMLLPNGRAKLTDFGIAQAVDDPTLTKTGMVVGSPAYLAPERLAGKEATPATDIWSLGAVLFHAVEGHGAFERETTAATLSAVIHEVPYLTRAQGPLAAAISGMLTAAPEGRLSGLPLHGLLKAAASAVDTVPAPTRMLPAGGEVTAVTNGALPPSAFPTAPASGAAGPGRRSPGKLAGAVFGALVLLGGLFAVGFGLGTAHGKKIQAAADVPAFDDVQVYTYGVPGEAGTINYTLGGADCGSGNVPMKAGLSYDTSASCTGPHDFERYYEFAIAGDGTPYPDPDRLAQAAQAACYSAASRARPIAGAEYAALIPSKTLWVGKNLPSGYSSDFDVICLEWVSGSQIPAVPTSTASSG